MQASSYFEQGLELLKVGSFGTSAGLYYGLGLIKERQGQGVQAIPILEQALEMYREERSHQGRYVDTSIVAKVHMSLANIHESEASQQALAKVSAAVWQLFYTHTLRPLSGGKSHSGCLEALPSLRRGRPPPDSECIGTFGASAGQARQERSSQPIPPRGPRAGSPQGRLSHRHGV